MRVVFTIAVMRLSSFWVVMFTMFAKHRREFRVGDKISYGTIRSILQEVKTVKTSIRCYGCRKYVCILTVFYRNKLAFIGLLLFESAPLSGYSSDPSLLRHFRHMSKMYEEVPENTKSKLTHRPTGRVSQIKVFERIDIPCEGRLYR
jgi:hypothetical protein